eukprot:SAG31_NODE_18885_length_624_cov_1.094231_1_plen_46_part_01
MLGVTVARTRVSAVGHDIGHDIGHDVAAKVERLEVLPMPLNDRPRA